MPWHAGNLVPNHSAVVNEDGNCMGHGLEQELEPSVAQEYLPLDEEIMQDYESMFPEEDLLDALLSSSDGEEDEIIDGEEQKGPQSPRVSASRQEPLVPQKLPSPLKRQNVDSVQPRVRPTRTTKDLQSVKLDELEALLDIDDTDEMENFGKVFDDEEEYQKFLVDLNAVDAHIHGDESANDDSEDEDFIQELKEMLEDQVDECFGAAYDLFSTKSLTSDMPIEKISSLFRKHKTDENKASRRKPKQLRRSLRLNKNEKKLYAAKLATKRTYLPLPPYIAAAHHSNMKDLDTLAVVMGLPMDSPVVPTTQVPLPSEFQPGMYQALAHHVRWRPPLPRSVRKLHSHLIASKENIPESAATRKSIGYFSAEQCSALANQMKEHVQMLIQIYCLSSLQNDHESMERSKKMLLTSGESLDLVRKITGDAKYSEWMPCIGSIIDLTENNTMSRYDEVELMKTPRLKIANMIWNGLPYQLLRVMANVRIMFNPQRQPIQDTSVILTSQMKFTPAEDRLLAWGIHKHAYEWKNIKNEFLPTKSESELKNRKKNKTGASKENIIKDVVSAITMPLTPAETHLIDQAIHYYGKQRGKWEDICREHLPYREPRTLSMLWADHTRSKCGPKDAHTQTRKMTS